MRTMRARIAWWIPRLALAGLIGCSSSGKCGPIVHHCTAVTALCVTVESDRAEVDRLEKSCGTCPSGESCNILDDPPRCRPYPGTEGVPCGTHPSGAGPVHACLEGYQCTADLKSRGVCRAEGAFCSPEKGCKLGLVCVDNVCVRKKTD